MPGVSRWGDVRPCRPRAGLLAPVIGWLGSRQERAIWSAMKRYLESAGDAVTGPDMSPICVTETGTESA